MELAWIWWIGSCTIIGVLFGVITGLLNQKKGYSYWTGFWAGFFLGIFGLLFVVIQEDKNKNRINTETNSADELLKYKQLLDSGVITESEFQEAKNKLLKKI